MMSRIDEILKRVETVSNQAAETLHQSMEESQKLTEEMKKRGRTPLNTNDVISPEGRQCSEETQGQSNPFEQTTEFAQVYNYIIIDSINRKPDTAFRQEKSKKRKGIFAPHVQIIFLEPGHYEIEAHGKTYQTSPAVVTADLSAGKYYCLGAAEDGLYIEERPYEWTL